MVGQTYCVVMAVQETGADVAAGGRAATDVGYDAGWPWQGDGYGMVAVVDRGLVRFDLMMMSMWNPVDSVANLRLLLGCSSCVICEVSCPCPYPALLVESRSTQG